MNGMLMMAKKFLGALMVAEGGNYDIDIEPDDTKSPNSDSPQGNRIIKAT